MQNDMPSKGSGAIASIPGALRDYQSFLDLGPGGPPYNILGWLVAKICFNPFMRDRMGTRMYDLKIEAGEGAGFINNLDLRKGERPAMGTFAVPQRQINQWPSAEITTKFMAEYGTFLDRNSHLIDRVPSILEARTDAAHVCQRVHLTPVARQMRREICHVHEQSEHSVHVTLAPTDCKKVIEAGWGERFPLAGSRVVRNITLGKIGVLPTEYVFVYAPRNDEEIAIVMEIVKASVQYVTGMSDVR
ncbi:hypothetical protein BDV18DRAFT_151496 [Aspergillus unguis]